MVMLPGQHRLIRKQNGPQTGGPHFSPPETSIEMEFVPCLLCGGNDFEPVIEAADPLTGQGGVFQVVRCLDCELHFTNPRPTENSIGLFYPSNYAPWGGQAKRPTLRQSGTMLWNWRCCEPGSAIRRKSISAVGSRQIRRWGGCGSTAVPSGRIGFPGGHRADCWISVAAAGIFWWRCKNSAGRWRAWTTPPPARDVTGRTGIPVHVGTLPHADILPESFDAVTMWNALEHVHQPRETVRAANRALRPGGILVVGVPNIASWAFEQFRERWYPLKVPRHLTHFTPNTLRETLNAEGFQVLSVDHIARPSFLRKSVRRVIKETGGSLRLRWLATRQGATLAASWTERTEQSEFIRAVAEKLPV